MARNDGSPATSEYSPAAAACNQPERKLVTFGVSTMRFLARILPASLLVALLAPPAFCLVVARLYAHKAAFRHYSRLPKSILGGRQNLSLPRYLLRRTMLLTNKAMYLWPDRFQEPRWAKRVRCVGAEYLDALRKGKQPVLLVTLHYGPSSLIHTWFRAQGESFSGFIGQDILHHNPWRMRVEKLADKVNGLTHVRSVYTPADLRRTSSIFRPGVIIGTALDVPERQHVAGEADGCRLLMAKGIFRLARMVDATVVPCLATTDGWLRSQIILGSPIPSELWEVEPSSEILNDLVSFFVPLIRERPELCEYLLLVHLREPSPQSTTAPASPSTDQQTEGQTAAAPGSPA